MPELRSVVQILFDQQDLNRVIKGILSDFRDIVASPPQGAAQARGLALSLLSQLESHARTYGLLSDDMLLYLHRDKPSFVNYYINSRSQLLTSEHGSIQTFEKAAISSALTYLLEEQGGVLPTFSGFMLFGAPIEDFGMAFLKVAAFVTRSFYIQPDASDFWVFNYFVNNQDPPTPGHLVALNVLILSFVLTRPALALEIIGSRNYSNPFLKLLLKLASYSLPNLDIRESEALVLADRVQDEAYTSLNVFLNELRELAREFEDALEGAGFKNQLAHEALYLGDSGKYYGRADVALEGHEHPEYLLRTEPAVQARYLVDRQTGRRYTRKDFAKKGHEHPEYLRWDNIQSADFLVTADGRLLVPDDLALRNHTHQYYAANERVPVAKVLTSELTQSYPVVPRDHVHDGTYLNRLLLDGEIAASTKAIGGEPVTGFARSEHTHENYLKVAQADSLLEKLSDPEDPKKGARGVAVYTPRGESVEGKPAFMLSGRLTVVGQAEVAIDDCKEVLFVFVTLVSGDDKASLPTWEPVVVKNRDGSVQHRGVRFVASNSGRASISYVILYEPI